MPEEEPDGSQGEVSGSDQTCEVHGNNPAVQVEKTVRGYQTGNRQGLDYVLVWMGNQTYVLSRF